MASGVTSLPKDTAARVCLACRRHYPADYQLCPQDGNVLTEHQALEDPLCGAVIGGTYRIVGRIDRGGGSDLYEAEHLRLARRFAVKVLREEPSQKMASRARFEREAHAMASIASPYVLNVVDLLETPDGRPCMVCELLQGENLRDHLRRRRKLAPLAAVQLARQIAAGLIEAHAQGIVHRDLKPSNVFVVRTARGEPSARLLDFGVAQVEAAPRITRSGGVIGTPSYMSPEQAHGQSTDPRTDVYGLGALLYRMVTGRPPHSGRDPKRVVERVRERDAPRVSEIMPELDSNLATIIETAMARDAAARFDNIQSLDTALAEVTNHLQQAEPTGPLLRLTRATRHVRTKATLLALGTVTAVSMLMGATMTTLGPAVSTALAAVIITVTALGTAFLAGQGLRSRWGCTASLGRWRRRLIAFWERVALGYLAFSLLFAGWSLWHGHAVDRIAVIGLVTVIAASLAVERWRPQARIASMGLRKA